MTPPQLTRNTPIVHVIYPLEVTRCKFCRFNLYATIANSISCCLCKRCNFDEPLLRKSWLNSCIATRTVTNCVNVWTLFSNDATQLFQLCNNCHTCIKAIHAIEFCAGAIHDAVLIHNHNKRNVMAHRHFKVVRIVGCSDLNRTSSKIRVNKFVGDDRNHAINKWEKYFCAHHVLITRIIWVNSNCSIAHHGLSTSCCNNDALLAFAITHLNEFTFIILVLYFNI